MRQLTSILLTTSVGAVALLPIGCQRYTYNPRGEVHQAPITVDEAMQIRDWEPMSARYTNPRFIAGPPGFWFIPAYDMPEPVYAAQETPMFLLQALALPITMWFPPLWTPIEYAGETLEPTWHAMPPLPEARPEEPPAPAEVTERGTDEPLPPPTPAPGAIEAEPYDDTAPGRTVVPGTQPTRGLEGERLPATQPRGAAAPLPMRDVPATTAAPRTSATAPAPTPAPAPARTVTPATRPAGTGTTNAPSRAAPAPAPAPAPARTATPATRPATAPARSINK